MTLPAPVDARVRIRNAGVAGPLGGGVYVSELQRLRLLDAAFAIVAEDGYKRMTARRVSARARVSTKTFYDLFADSEDCFLAAFDHTIDQFAGIVLPAWEGEREWVARIRAGLQALLVFLDREPALCRLVFVEALGAGPRVLARRAQVSEVLRRAVDEGRAGMKAGQALPPLTGEGVVGAAFTVIHARLLEQQPKPLTGLSGALMATIVLPYRGHAAAARELKRLAPKPTNHSAQDNAALTPGRHSRAGEQARLIDFRPTQRTQMVLAAVADLDARGSGPNNREVSDLAGVADQGQISKLLARLERLGLLKNTGDKTLGAHNAWWLTARGEEILSASKPQDRSTATSRARRTAASRTDLQVNGTRETR